LQTIFNPFCQDAVDNLFPVALDQKAVKTIIVGVTRADQLVANSRASSLPPWSADLHRQLKDFYDSNVRPHVRGGI